MRLSLLLLNEHDDDDDDDDDDKVQKRDRVASVSCAFYRVPSL